MYSRNFVIIRRFYGNLNYTFENSTDLVGLTLNQRYYTVLDPEYVRIYYLYAAERTTSQLRTRSTALY